MEVWMETCMFFPVAKKYSLFVFREARYLCRGFQPACYPRHLRGGFHMGIFYFSLPFFVSWVSFEMFSTREWASNASWRFSSRPSYYFYLFFFFLIYFIFIILVD